MNKEEFEKDIKILFNNNNENEKITKEYNIINYFDFFIHYNKEEDEIYIKFKNINKEKKLIIYNINRIYEFINYFINLILKNKKIEIYEILFEDVCDQTYSFIDYFNFNYENEYIIIKNNEKEMRININEEFNYKI